MGSDQNTDVAQVRAQFDLLQQDLTGYAKYPGRSPSYAFENDIPQTLSFVIDAMPTIQRIILRYPRNRVVSFLDFGPGYGSAAGLISEMFSSRFLWAKMQVDALDVTGRRADFIRLTYPRVNLIVGRIEDLPPERKWDIVYCSNVIEHTPDPAKLISDILKHTAGTAIFSAPFAEFPLGPAHASTITEETFQPFEPEEMRTYFSLGWPRQSPLDRRQILVAIKGR